LRFKNPTVFHYQKITSRPLYLTEGLLFRLGRNVIGTFYVMMGLRRNRRLRCRKLLQGMSIRSR